jgi:hypothetical protein
MRSKTLLAAAVAAAISYAGTGLASANTINITPSKDNTLYEYVAGDYSNALGNHFFAGETNLGELRRGVFAFDIAASIPPGSTITGVSLSMNMSRTFYDTAGTIELHKLLADWGEGTSSAPGEEGDGAPATTNDATWRHRFFDTIFWAMQGGDFSATVSASQSVGPVGHYMWSSAQMVADVQSWLDNPGSNFGWLILGDESGSGTSKRFDTRESASPPVLTVQYTPPTTPTPTPTPTPIGTHPAFFTGETALGGGWYYLQFPNGTPFGYYSYLTDPNYIYHLDLGFEYLFDANDVNHAIYFYDFASSSFFYTSPTLFPDLYDFSLNAWLYYLPDASNPGRYSHNPRWFFNFATGQWINL